MLGVIPSFYWLPLCRCDVDIGLVVKDELMECSGRA